MRDVAPAPIIPAQIERLHTVIAVVCNLWETRQWAELQTYLLGVWDTLCNLRFTESANDALMLRRLAAVFQMEDEQ